MTASTNFQSQQAQLAQALAAGLPPSSARVEASVGGRSAAGVGVDAGSSGSTTLATQLIDAIPYFQCDAVQSAHRGALAGACLLALPTNGIGVPPTQNTPNVQNVYSYSGSYQNFIQVFGPSGAAATTAQAMAQALQSTMPSLDAAWLQGYGVALVADACGSQGGQGVNTNLLRTTESAYNQQLLPALTASYVLALTQAYGPTVQAFAQVAQQKKQVETIFQINQAVAAGAFKTALQAVVDQPNGQQAVDWFMYNLWVLLRGLGLSVSDIDVLIGEAQKLHLGFSGAVGPGTWWTGGYVAWYEPLSGADVQSGNLTAPLPVLETSNYWPPTWPSDSQELEMTNGYSQSFMTWSCIGQAYNG